MLSFRRSAFRACHNDRDIACRNIRTKLLQDRDAVFLRQHDIQQDQLGLLTFQSFPECQGIRKTLCLKSGDFQRIQNQIPDSVIIFNTVNYKRLKSLASCFTDEFLQSIPFGMNAEESASTGL